MSRSRAEILHQDGKRWRWVSRTTAERMQAAGEIVRDQGAAPWPQYRRVGSSDPKPERAPTECSNMRGVSAAPGHGAIEIYADHKLAAQRSGLDARPSELVAAIDAAWGCG